MSNDILTKARSCVSLLVDHYDGPFGVIPVLEQSIKEIERLRVQSSKLEEENERLRTALAKLRDCDWVISLPDRMDAVRDIARKALEEKR